MILLITCFFLSSCSLQSGSDFASNANQVNRSNNSSIEDNDDAKPMSSFSAEALAPHSTFYQEKIFKMMSLLPTQLSRVDSLSAYTSILNHSDVLSGSFELINSKNGDYQILGHILLIDKKVDVSQLPYYSLDSNAKLEDVKTRSIFLAILLAKNEFEAYDACLANYARVVERNPAHFASITIDVLTNFNYNSSRLFTNLGEQVNSREIFITELMYRSPAYTKELLKQMQSMNKQNQWFRKYFELFYNAGFPTGLDSYQSIVNGLSDDQASQRYFSQLISQYEQLRKMDGSKFVVSKSYERVYVSSFGSLVWFDDKDVLAKIDQEYNPVQIQDNSMVHAYNQLKYLVWRSTKK